MNRIQTQNEQKNMVTGIKKKFFFDQNIFDEHGNIEGLLEEEEPAPTFSEAELASAKKAAFQKGYTQAAQEAKNSHEQKLSLILERLVGDMSTLFAQETAREKLYERESVELTRSVFEKLFPYIAEKHGFDELSGALETILQGHSAQRSIQIRVHPDFTEEIKTSLQKLQHRIPDLCFDIQGDEALQNTACKLSWEHGGALHDTQAMAEEVLSILNDGLAGNAVTVHDEKTGKDNKTARSSGAVSSSPHNPAPEEKPDE